MIVRWIRLGIVSTLPFAGVQEVQAVAFKCHNQTNLKFRMRVHDRGEWRDWQEMGKGYWGDTAKKVKRTEHTVEIEVWTTNRENNRVEWIPFYRGDHESRRFTRIVHLYQDQQGNVVMTWYDEPPGCRGKPAWDGQKTHDGCLAKSGWTEALLKKPTREMVREIAKTAIKAIIAGA